MILATIIYRRFVELPSSPFRKLNLSLCFMNADCDQPFRLFMLSLAKPHQYYQVFLSQGVGMGIGVGLVFTPTLSNISHIFYARKSRALATGVALSGTSVGALSFPISEL
jgi:hypothetical protein